MKILGIEASGAVCGAALTENGSLQAERSIDAPQVHAEKLLLFIDEVLVAASTRISDVDGIAVSIGPGSFTGLRIGLSVAKGLAFASDKPTLAVPSLEALAVGALRRGLATEGDLLVPLIDARRDEVFVAAFLVIDGRLQCTTDSCALPVTEVPNVFRGGRRVVLLGDGAEKLQNHLLREKIDLRVELHVPSHADRCASAIDVATLGEERLRLGVVADLASLEPMYVKEFYTTLQPQPTPI